MEVFVQACLAIGRLLVTNEAIGKHDCDVPDVGERSHGVEESHSMELSERRVFEDDNALAERNHVQIEVATLLHALVWVLIEKVYLKDIAVHTVRHCTFAGGWTHDSELLEANTKILHEACLTGLCSLLAGVIRVGLGHD